VLDKVTEKKSMASERLLYILEDLFKLQEGVHERILPQIGLRVSPQLHEGQD
jgi:hypothetical protein